MIERYVQLPLNDEYSELHENALKGVSFDRLQDHFAEIYGRRNTVYLPDRVSRINYLNVAIGDMQDAVRKDMPEEHMNRMVARTISRTFCIANGVNDVSVASAMVEKYPISGCAYCHNIPCTCEDMRPNPTIVFDSRGTQQNWSIKDWQQHLNTLYGEKNKEKGIINTTNRLFKEVAELVNLEYSITRDRLSMDEVEHEYSLELADCVAWTMAVANYYDIDLENAIVEKYSQGCNKCLQNPCICGPHNFKQAKIQN